MFNLKSLATLAATMAVLATAAPAPPAAPDAALAEIDSRQTLGTTITACEHPSFTGTCWSPFIGNSNCVNVPGWFDNQISSIKNNNSGGYHCIWYEHFDCQGRSYTNQNDAKLQDGDGFFDDSISSLKCFIRWGGGGTAPY